MWVLQKLEDLNSRRRSSSNLAKNETGRGRGKDSKLHKNSSRTLQGTTTNVLTPTTKTSLRSTISEKEVPIVSQKCQDTWVRSNEGGCGKRRTKISILPSTLEEGEVDQVGLNICLELRSFKTKMRNGDDRECGQPAGGGSLTPPPSAVRSHVVRRVHRAVTKCRKLKCKCCRSICPQVILILANFLFLVCGWSLIVGGVWLYLYQDTLMYSHLLSSNHVTKGRGRSASALNFNQIPLVLITSGVFVASVSFLGCCGACSESVCFLGFYSILLLFLITAEIILALLTTQVMDHISTSTSKAMIEQLSNTYNRTADPINNTSPHVAKVTWAWDHLQSKVKCCGVYGPRDYIKTSWFNHTDENDGNFVPLSCCASRHFQSYGDDDVTGNDHRGDDNDVEVKIRNYCQIESLLLSVSHNQTKNIHTQGCHVVFARWVDAHVGKFRCILFLLLAIQMIDFISAWCLLAHLRKKQSEYWWCDDDDDDY